MGRKRTTRPKCHYKILQKRKNLFQKGNTHACAVTSQSDSDNEQDTLMQEGLVDHVEESSTRQLRSTAPTGTQSESESEEEDENDLSDLNFIANVAKLETLINSVANMEHGANCSSKNFKLNLTEQKIISTSWSVHCVGCDLKIPAHKMYPEIRKTQGQAPVSSLNMALGASLIGSSIQGTQISEILGTLGIDPGSVDGINRNCKQMSNVIHGLGIESFEEVRAELEQRAEGVHLTADSCYNNPNKYDAKNPFQKGMIRMSIVVDAKTGKIAHLDLEIKYCLRGSSRMRIGLKPDCDPVNHVHTEDGSPCDATALYAEPIGNEAASIARHAEFLRTVDVTEVTTDGDCGVGESIKAKENFGPNTDHTIDFIHKKRSLTKALIAHVKVRTEAFTRPAPTPTPTPSLTVAVTSDDQPSTSNDAASRDAPPSTSNEAVESESTEKSTRPKRKESDKQRADRIFRQFCEDLSTRIDQDVSYHFKNVRQNTAEGAKVDLAVVAENLLDVPVTAIKCVAGLECGDNCTNTSGTCLGGMHNRTKLYSHPNGLIDLNENEINQFKLLIVEKRTSQKALKLSNPKTTTQTNEAINSMITKYAPKRTTFTATIKGRAHRAALTKNKGSSLAIFTILNAIGHNIAPRVRNKIIKMEERSNFRKQMHRTFIYRHRRQLSRVTKHRMHDEARDSMKVTYQQGIEVDGQPTSDASN